MARLTSSDPPGDPTDPKVWLAGVFDRAAETYDLTAGAYHDHFAGFDSVEVQRIHHEVRLADADEWWAWKWSYSLRGVREQLSSERPQRLRREAAEHIERIPGRDGLPLRLEALVATSRR